MFKSNRARRSLAVVAALALVAGSLPVEARVGSSSSSSSSGSRSSSFSSSSVSRPSTPSYSSSSSSRVGNGGSVGMQRSNVMNNVRSTPSAPPSAAPSSASSSYAYRPSAPATPSTPEKKDRSWMAPAAAGALAGAAATYALTHNSNPQPTNAPAPAPQHAPAPAPQYEQGSFAGGSGGGYPMQAQAPMGHVAPMAPVQMQQPVQSSGGFGFGSFLLLLILAGVGYVVYRRFVANGGDVGAIKRSLNVGMPKAAAPVAPVAATANALEVMAKQFFTDLQDLNNRGDLATLKTKTTSDLYEVLAEDIRTRGEPSQTSVVSVKATVVDEANEGNRQIVSVRFEALVSENPNQAAEPVDEVWHFVKDNGDTNYKLAGIEQV